MVGVAQELARNHYAHSRYNAIDHAQREKERREEESSPNISSRAASVRADKSTTTASSTTRCKVSLDPPRLGRARSFTDRWSAERYFLFIA